MPVQKEAPKPLEWTVPVEVVINQPKEKEVKQEVKEPTPVPEPIAEKAPTPPVVETPPKAEPVQE